MITMNELVDLRMQQHIAHEIYRQQIMQRIPGKYDNFYFKDTNLNHIFIDLKVLFSFITKMNILFQGFFRYCLIILHLHCIIF